MILMGSAAIEELGRRVDRHDPEESSHWRSFHAEFRFAGDGFGGLRGFGGAARPYSGLRFVAHRLMQRPFRRMAAALPGFDEADRLAGQITSAQERAYDLDVLRQALTLAFLQRHVPDILSQNTTACVIGDGFASMTALLLGSRSARRVILVNLTKTLLVDLWYLRLWMGPAQFDRVVCLMTENADAVELVTKKEWSRVQVVAVQAADKDLLTTFPLDLVVNIASMQEMNLASIAAYFSAIRRVAAEREVAFYCCNRVCKVLPDGTETRFFDYPWAPGDTIVVDELCPWHQRYYVWSPPYYRPYDGPIQHRIAYMAGAPGA
jgi:putative sugar O-methyltransferase